MRIYVINETLYKKYKTYNNIYLVDEINNFTNKHTKNKTIVNNYMEFGKYNNIFGNYTLNVTNIYTAYYLLKSGLNNICLSLELTKDQNEALIDEFMNKFNTMLVPEIVVYGTTCNMVIKRNILNIKKDYFRYRLKDSNDRFFPIYLENNKTYVMNYQKRMIY